MEVNEKILTEQEIQFILKVLSQISISPASNDALGIVQLVQSIQSKLSE